MSYDYYYYNYGYDYNYSNSYNYSDVEVNGTELSDQGENFYVYKAYAFERVIYVYIWNILVIVTCILNTVVMSVLLRRNMRNSSINIILMAIAISDSLTGLVTVPSYIAVFQQYATSSTSSNQTLDISSLNTSNISPADLDYIQEMNDLQTTQVDKTQMDAYLLTENLCDLHMISKFFISKIFHVASVRLTLFLGFQRFLSVYKPFHMRREVNPFTIKRTIFICIAIFVTAPFLHLYHVFKDKSINGDCKWSVERGKDCGRDCVYFWIVLLVENILPALILTCFSIYIISRLITPAQVNDCAEVGSNKIKAQTPVTKRNRKQRKTSIMVLTVVVVFLAVEIPYAIFLLLNSVRAMANLPLDLETNRIIWSAIVANNLDM